MSLVLIISFWKPIIISIKNNILLIVHWDTKKSHLIQNLLEILQIIWKDIMQLVRIFLL